MASKFSSSLKKMNSQQFIGKNKTLLIWLVIIVVMWKPLKAIYKRLVNAVSTNESEQEAGADGGLLAIEQTVNHGNLSISEAECKNVAHSILVELGKHDFWLNFAGDFGAIASLLAKNKSELSSNIYEHFNSNGSINATGFVDNWGTLEPIKRFNPYSKDTLKLIYTSFGTPLYDHSTGGEPLDGVVGGLTGYLMGTESDWKLNNWCKANLSTTQYNIMKGIYSEVGLNYF